MRYNRILLQMLCNIGDVVIGTSAAALLKEIWPQAKITVMVRSVAREVVENNPVIDEVILTDYRSGEGSIRSMLQLIQTVKEGRFDASISFDGKQRSALISVLAGIPERIGVDQMFRSIPFLRKQLFSRIITPDCNKELAHQAEFFQAVIREVTGAEKKLFCRPVMARVLEENAKNAAALFAVLPPHKEKIALCVKGTFALKDWEPQKFVQLIQELEKKKPDSAFMIIGAPGDYDYAQQIIDQLDTTVANFCGKTNLVDVKAILEKVDLFVSVDTGTVHIASTVDVPTVVLYGCTAPERWHPLNPQYRTVSAKLSCTPCSLSPQECPEHQCMRNISVEHVLNEINQLLTRKE